MNKMKFSLDSEKGTLSETDAKRYFSRVGFAAGTLIFVYYVASLAISYLIYFFAPWLLEYAVVNQLFSFVPLYGIAFPCFWLILRKLPVDPVSSERLGAKGFFVAFCIAIALMMAGNTIGNTLITLVEKLSGAPQTNPVEEATVGQAWWMNLIFVGILAPILEELVFRKVLCNRLLPLGEGYAVVLSATIFGLVHGNFSQFFYAFALGALFAFIYVKTGRIRYSIIYHSLINIMGGVFAPWIIERVTPMLQESFMEEMLALAEAGDMAGWMNLMAPYAIPMLLLMAYEFVMMGLAVVGVVFLIKDRKKFRFRKGLLPPPQEGRVANVFCNVGVAAALTVFTAVFVLSLVG